MPNLPFIIAESAPAPTRVSGEVFGGDRGLGALGQAVSGAGSQLGEINDRLYTFEQESIARRDLALADTELSDFENELQSDPDYNTHEARYQQKVKEIESRKGGLTGPFASEFSARVAGIGQDGIARVRGRVRERRVDSGRAAGIVERQQYADKAAQAESLEERDRYRGLIADSLLRETSVGARKAEDAVVEAARVDQEIFDADLRESINTNPADAVRRLSDPAGEFKDMREEQRQVWLGRAVDASRADVSAAYTQERRAHLASKREKAAAQVAAETELLSIMSPDDVGFITAQNVRDRWTDLGDKADYWMSVAVTRGQFPKDAVNNPNLIADLTDAITRGEDVTARVNEGMAEGMLEVGTGISLKDKAANRRFNASRKWLTDAVKPQAAFGIPPTRAQIEAQADAALSFERWVQDNPQATPDLAEKQAREIAKRTIRKLGVAADISPGTATAERKAKARSDALSRVGVPRGTTPTPEMLRRIESDPVYRAELQNISAYEKSRNAVGEP